MVGGGQEGFAPLLNLIPPWWGGQGQRRPAKLAASHLGGGFAASKGASPPFILVSNLLKELAIQKVMSTKYIFFHNDMDVPIVIDSWVDQSNKLESLKVLPHEKLILHSSVGEWHMHAMFEDEYDSKLWKEKGLSEYVIIGKFRSTPCIQGDYSWVENSNVFECVYEDKTMTLRRVSHLPVSKPLAIHCCKSKL